MNNDIIRAIGPIVVLLGFLVLALYHLAILPQENAVLLAGGALMVIGLFVYVILYKKTDKK